MDAAALQIGLIGCGRIAQMVHLHVLSSLPSVRLAALAEADADRLAEARKRAPRARAYRDYHDLLADDAVQAVVICLPTGMHADAAVAAFAAGKHVYLEKPIATTLDDAQRVLDAARGASRIGMIGFNYRFHPLIQQARQQIAAGAVGRIVAIRTSFSSVSRPLPQWKCRRVSGGGALLDLGSHHFDLVPYIAGSPIADVQAEIRSLRVEDDTAAVQMRLASGVPVQSFHSISAVDDDRIEIIGDRGRLCIDRLSSRFLAFTPAQRDGGYAGRVAEGVTALLQTPRRLRDALRSSAEPSQRAALAAFVDAVRRGQPSPVDLEAGYRSLTALIAAEQSAQSGGQRIAVAGAPAVETAPAPASDLPPLDLADTTKPALSVVVVATHNFAGVRRTVRHLRQQTIADRIELVVVAESEQAISDAKPQELEGFFAVRTVAAGRIEHIDACASRGIKAASAELIASIEDHAFVDPDWAEHVLAGFQAGDGQWAAVASMICNGNPGTGLSWCNLLMGYGAWYGAVREGPIDQVSLHNICLRRSALLPLWDELEKHMGRSGTLLTELRRLGRQFYFAPKAKVRHVNPSLLKPTVLLRFRAGRLAAATRATLECFSPVKRAIYALASPVFPLLRLRTMRGKFAEAGARVFPALALGLGLDALGQALGFALGAGRSTREVLARFEFDRARHLRPDERDLLLQ